MIKATNIKNPLHKIQNQEKHNNQIPQNHQIQSLINQNFLQNYFKIHQIYLISDNRREPR